MLLTFILYHCFSFQTIRLYREFEVDEEPIWHYNANSKEYDGRHNADLRQSNWSHGSSVWPDQWPKGSAYPDSFIIGDPYTNAYEGIASLTDIRYYEPVKKSACERTILMTTRDIIKSGDRLISPAANLYLDQKANANLQLWKGSPENPELLLWQSKMDEPSNVTYYTEIQRDGKLVTYAQGLKVNGVTTRSIVWMTEVHGPDDNRTYSLAVECEEKGGSLAIYAGPPQTSQERLWEATVETQTPTSRPTMSPTTNDPPVQTINCNPLILMKSGDFLYPEKRVIDFERGFHLIQLLNGNVEIRWGSPEYPGDLIWESGYNGDSDRAYYTKLEANGNLVTWKTEQDHSFSSVWETSTYGPTLAVYYLVLDCSERGDKIAVYQGHPEEGGTVVWNVNPASNAAAQVSFPKPTIPPTSMPSVSPTIEETDIPTRNIVSSPTAEPSIRIAVNTDSPSSSMETKPPPPAMSSSMSSPIPAAEIESAALSPPWVLVSWIVSSLGLFYI